MKPTHDYQYNNEFRVKNREIAEEADLEELQEAEWTAADEEYDRRRDELLDEARREREA